jgi:N-acetylmuramate 1-kinase
MLVTTKILNQSVHTWLEHWLSSQRISKPVQITPLAGDGSQRSFYRLKLSDSENFETNSLVLLSDPEWLSSKDYPAHQAYLAKLGHRVPRFIAVDPKVGCLLMEDLGDEYLQTRLATSPSKRLDWLKKAVLTLAELHSKTYPVPESLPAAQRRFDAEKLEQELSFTFEHLERGFLEQKQPNPARARAVRSYCEKLGDLRPLVFCHRDYHSRNLMVCNSELYLIDFQDARLGPPQYDLASLIYDAYVPLRSEDRTVLTDLYVNEVRSTPLGTKINFELFERDLEWVAFQRVVKAAGSFASFYTRFGKQSHLTYLLPALDTASALQKKNDYLRTLSEAIPVGVWIAKAQGELKKIEK